MSFSKNVKILNSNKQNGNRLWIEYEENEFLPFFNFFLPIILFGIFQTSFNNNFFCIDNTFREITKNVKYWRTFYRQTDRKTCFFKLYRYSPYSIYWYIFLHFIIYLCSNKVLYKTIWQQCFQHCNRQLFKQLPAAEARGIVFWGEHLSSFAIIIIFHDFIKVFHFHCTFREEFYDHKHRSKFNFHNIPQPKKILYTKAYLAEHCHRLCDILALDGVCVI